MLLERIGAGRVNITLLRCGKIKEKEAAQISKNRFGYGVEAAESRGLRGLAMRYSGRSVAVKRVESIGVAVGIGDAIC